MKFSISVVKCKLLENIFGATLDKILPLIISFFLTKFMSNESFGYWTQYFVILLVVSSAIISPFQLFFSRDFSQKKTKKVLLFNFPIIIFVFTITSLIIFVFFKPLLHTNYILELILIIYLFIIYSLNATYLRFCDMDAKYAKFSLLRVLLFLGAIFLVLMCGSELNFRNLIHCFLIAHIPFLFITRKNLIISWEVKKKSLAEFSRLFLYGLSTALLSGVDKLIMVFAGYSYEDLSFYAYAIAFTSLPSFLVEAVKQYISPKLYKDLSKFKGYSITTTQTVLKFIVALVLIQFTLPYLGYKIFEHLNILNLGLIRSDSFVLLLNVFNVGFSFHIVYHFLNPYMFYYDRSMYLLILQSCSILAYAIVVVFSKNLSDEALAAIRILMFLFVLAGTAIPLLNKRLKNKYVYKEL